MDIQDIKKQIDELLLLNEGKELILEGARNFRYIDGPSLEFYPNRDDEEYDEYDDELFYENLPEHSNYHLPYYLDRDVMWHPTDSVNEDFACIACEYGYYEGMQMYIETPDIIEFIDRFCVAEEDDNGNGLYSYGSIQYLTEEQMINHVRQQIDQEVRNATEVLMKLHKEYGGVLKNVHSDFFKEPELTGEEFDESYLGESKIQSKYHKGQKFIHNEKEDDWEITGIEYKPNGGFYYDITNRSGRTPFGDTINLTLFVPEKHLDTKYTDVTKLHEPESSGEEFDECVLKENFYDYLPRYASRDETMTQRAINIIHQIPTHKMFKLVWNPEDYGANVEKTYNIEKIVEMYVDHEFGKSEEETEYFFEKLKNLNPNEHFQWSGNSNMSLWDIDFSVAQGTTDSVPVYSRSYMEEKYGFIHGWDSTALVNVAINIYDIDWDTYGEEENLPTEISEYYGLGESDMDFFAQQMSRDGYLDVDEIEQYMGDYADDLIDRFPCSTYSFSYGILNIKEVKDMIIRYVQNNIEEPSEPESTGEEFDECALNEELEQIINISRF